MSDRDSALSLILHSPARVLGVVLMLVFIAEVGVMFLLPYVIPNFLGETGKAFFDAVLLTTVCAPALWWVIIGPLRRIAIQERERSETIVANAGEGIITLDSDGVILSSNRALAKLLSVELSSLVGQRVDSFLTIWPASFTTLPTSFRVVAHQPDGATLPVEVSVSEYPSETRTLRIAVIRDLTDAERAESERLTMAREAEALRAQQMTVLAQLATGVAHEIRNPLTSIKMLIQVNRGKFAKEGLPTDDLELVEQEIRRMERSVTSLLEFARPEQGERSSFPIQNVISKTVQLIEGRCGQQSVTLHIDCQNEPLLVDGDASQLQQLLLNLSLNALDAMPHGGELTIRAQAFDKQLELSVVDTGEGIASNMQEKLFVPFSTSKPNGVGLGLGICRRIAASHGGTVSGQNLARGGAEFRVTLPLAIQLNSQENATTMSEASCNAS